jgi:Xaa-Pro aminopeptidase
MRQDLPRLLKERELDAALVMGNTLDSPTVYYLTGGVKLEGALIILRPFVPAVLIHSPMERDGAAQTGMQCLPFTHWDVPEIARQMGGDALKTRVETLRQMLAELDVRGRIGVYGHGEIGQHHALLTALAEALPESELVSEYSDDLFSQARMTKDDAEIEAMAQVGKLTCQVVEGVADLLTSRPVAGHYLLAPGGEPMTIGHVKDFVRAELARRGLEEPSEHIFAMGADAGVPHNGGNRADVLELGKAIVFDLFPRPVGGGYYHDVTRTWCLGHAPEQVEQAYEDVMAAFDLAVAELRVHRPTAEIQSLTCDYFESQGHRTIKSEPTTTSGYVHSLAHGLGLEVHEAPSFRLMAGNRAVIEKGMVFTIEPGLYYPERGYGVRVEDTYYCDREGAFHSLTPVNKQLVLPVRR